MESHLQDSGLVTVKMDISEDTCSTVASLVRSMLDSNAKMIPFLFNQNTGGNGRMRRTKNISYPFGRP